ncbi:MAG: nuclear transport factor 2 family protein [Caulobacterales bacterium]
MSVADENLKVIRRGYDLFFAGQTEEFFTMFDDEVEMVEADSLPYGGTLKGKSTVTKAIMSVRSNWDKMTLDIHTLTAGDDYVIAYGTFAATGLKTGIKATFPLAEVWRLKNGKVVFLNPVYGDVALANKAMGHVPA